MNLRHYSQMQVSYIHLPKHLGSPGYQQGIGMFCLDK